MQEPSSSSASKSRLTLSKSSLFSLLVSISLLCIALAVAISILAQQRASSNHEPFPQNGDVSKVGDAQTTTEPTLIPVAPPSQDLATEPRQNPQTETPQSSATEYPQGQLSEPPPVMTAAPSESPAMEPLGSPATKSSYSPSTEPPSESPSTEPQRSRTSEPFEWKSTESPQNLASESSQSRATKSPENPAKQPPQTLATEPSELKQGRFSCARSKSINPLPVMPGKKGAAFVLNKGRWVTNIPRVKALNPKWNYSWNHERVAAQPDDIEFIPMIWGAWDQDGLNQQIQEHIVPQLQSGQVKRVLGFNEPDSWKQAGMPVDSTVGFWGTLESLNLPLVGPAAAHSNGQWAAEFNNQVNDNCLRMEYAGIHWYDEPNTEAFKRSMRENYEKFGQRPIMLTEFAVADWNAEALGENSFSMSQVLAFMKEVLPWLEESEMIAGYAWFSFNSSDPNGGISALFDSDGTITPLGRYYASVTPDNPEGDQTIEAPS